jgi:hypothetical protein
MKIFTGYRYRSFSHLVYCETDSQPTSAKHLVLLVCRTALSYQLNSAVKPRVFLRGTCHRLLCKQGFEGGQKMHPLRVPRRSQSGAPVPVIGRAARSPLPLYCMPSFHQLIFSDTLPYGSPSSPSPSRPIAVRHSSSRKL